MAEAFPEVRGAELVSWLKENPGTASQEQVDKAVTEGIEAIVALIANQRREAELAKYFDARSLAILASMHPRFALGPRPQ